jgi:hypothetical protein
MTAHDIELAMARHLGILHPHGGMGNNRNLLIPNFTAMFLCHECDLLWVTRSGWGHEIEIKISRADLKADLKKDHQHIHGLISYLWFAIPDTLRDCIDLVPERAGIFLVDSTGFVRKIRNAKKEPGARQFTLDERVHLGHIAAMRIWGLKRKLLEKG